MGKITSAVLLTPVKTHNSNTSALFKTSLFTTVTYMRNLRWIWKTCVRDAFGT